MATFYIQNNYEGSNPNVTAGPNVGPNPANYHYCTFHPLDKYVEEVENNKKLVEKTEKLYEALLKTERKKNSPLEKLLNEKKK
jgi:hypothetical protein